MNITTTSPLTGLPLPLGRYSVSIDEFAASQFVQQNKRRLDIWEDFEQLLEGVRGAAGNVSACWIGGSYLTEKPHPSDIDCVFVIDHALLSSARLDDKKRAVLNVVSNGQAKFKWELLVDAYILEWHPRNGMDEGTQLRKEQYLQARGFYDDFWSRTRTGSVREQSVPQRGYLEVIIDGYS